jgi:hypothetical protein
MLEERGARTEAKEDCCQQALDAQQKVNPPAKVMQLASLPEEIL